MGKWWQLSANVGLVTSNKSTKTGAESRARNDLGSQSHQIRQKLSSSGNAAISMSFVLSVYAAQDALQAAKQTAEPTLKSQSV